MDSRERVKLALSHCEADRIPIHDSAWGATVDRWRTEGLPSGVSPKDYFGYEMWELGADTSPLFPTEILSEDDEYIVERNSFGGIRKCHRDHSTTPMVIDYMCKTKEDWEKLKPRLKPTTTELIGSPVFKPSIVNTTEGTSSATTQSLDMTGYKPT